MLGRGPQSQKYLLLLKQQEQEDAERKDRLEELRKKQLRETIKRKRDEQEARKREQAAKERRLEDTRAQKQRKEEEEKRQAAREEDERRKRPLSVDEAKARRDRAEAARSTQGLAKQRQELKSVTSRPISSKYSSLLASAPTKLERVPLSGVGDGFRKHTPAIPPQKRSAIAVQDSARLVPQTSVKPVSKLIKKGSIAKDKSIVQDRLRSPSKLAQKSLQQARSVVDQSPRENVAARGTVQKSVAQHREPPKPTEARPQKRKTPDVYKSRKERSEDDDDDDYRAHTGGQSIWEIMNPGKSRTMYLNRDIDSDEEGDMEANADDILREEQRAARAAKVEDEREAKMLQEHEARKAAKRKRVK